MCNQADERGENAPAPAIDIQHEMNVDGDGRLEVGDETDGEYDKTDFLGLIKEMTRRTVPNTMTFIPHRRKHRFARRYFRRIRQLAIRTVRE